jgi:hypothetical protein
VGVVGKSKDNRRVGVGVCGRSVGEGKDIKFRIEISCPASASYIPNSESETVLEIRLSSSSGGVDSRGSTASMELVVMTVQMLAR